MRFFEGNSLTCMTLYKITSKIKTGIEQNIIKDIENLKNTLIKLYEASYGYDLELLRSRLKKMKSMKTVAVQEVRHGLQTLNIIESQAKYVWLARFYAILPLPDGWERTEPEFNTDVYLNTLTGEKLHIKPCYYYIIKLLERIKTDPDFDRIWKIWMLDANHVFEDGFGRIMLVSNSTLFHFGEGEPVENNQEIAQNVVSKEAENLSKYSHPVVDRCNHFMKNQSSLG